MGSKGHHLQRKEWSWISQILIKCLNHNIIISFGNFVVYGSILLVCGFGQNIKYLSRPTAVALAVFGKTEDNILLLGKPSRVILTSLQLLVESKLQLERYL